MTRLFLFVFLSFSVMQACSQKPANTNGTPTPATSTATPATPPAAEAPKPVAYASNKAGWLVDLDEAYAISVKEKKPILANFTGSDWCGWCKKLDADVFSKPEFKTWAEKNVVLLELDFPRRTQIPEKNRQQNAAMQQAMGISGYPTIWLFNMTKDAASGQYQINKLGKTGYAPSAEQFISALSKFVQPQ